MSAAPHSWGRISIEQSVIAKRLCLTLKERAPKGPKAGDDGWSVIVSVEAFARAEIMEGSPAPRFDQCSRFVALLGLKGDEPAPNSNTFSPCTLHAAASGLCSPESACSIPSAATIPAIQRQWANRLRPSSVRLVLPSAGGSPALPSQKPASEGTIMRKSPYREDEKSNCWPGSPWEWGISSGKKCGICMNDAKKSSGSSSERSSPDPFSGVAHDEEADEGEVPETRRGRRRECSILDILCD